MVLLGPGWCKIGFRASGNLTPARKSSQFLPHAKSQGDQLNVLIVPVIGHERCRPAISCPGRETHPGTGAMLERISSAAVGAADPGIGARRAVVAALNAATMAVLLWLAAATLSPGGYGLLDWTLLVSFAVILPWTVVGFWNAVIGLCIMRLAGAPVALVFPTAASVRGDEAITASTAILVCIRNEMPDRVVRNLEPMLGGLVEAKVAGRFHVYVLSDTSDPAIAAAEEKNFGVTAQKWQGEIGLTYRRRARDTGIQTANQPGVLPSS